MPTREDILIPTEQLPPFEVAAKLLSILAFPVSKIERNRFENALCYKYLEQLAKDKDWANRPQAIKPLHLLQHPDKVNKIFSAGHEIIARERLIAGKMAAPAIAHFLGEPGATDHRPTGSAVIDSIGRDLDRLRGTNSGGDKHNITSRIWAPSKSVLHLCFALHTVIHQFGVSDNSSNGALNTGDLIENSALTYLVIARGVAFMPHVREVFGIPISDQIAVHRV